MKPVADYLRVNPSYCEVLGGLHWSKDGEALEFGDGSTFAFSSEIISFLEGFVSRRPLIDFNHVLHFLYLLRDRTSGKGDNKLQEAFDLAGRMHRNAGAFCAALCTNIPAVPHPPTLAIWQHVVLRWYRIMEALASSPVTADVPPLTPVAFLVQIRTAAAAYIAEELLHWFRYGTGPVKDAAATIAQEVVVTKPRSLKGVLADLAERPRLAGAVPFVAQMVSALSLPPRRLAHHELPTGGYADVTTTGQPEQILPSQFALDDLEFQRRFAERELLYFRREEPHARTREELVVLLDQGVRTWGVVRLVLSAAALALGKMAERRRQSFLVASTSGGGVVLNPTSLEPDQVAQCLEASDLSANPGLALERVLEDRTAAARDVVLLTHPRNLAEEDVTAAAHRANQTTRLFAVAVTERGDVQFSELKHGVPLTLSQFHVNLEKSQPPPAEPPVRDPDQPWRGDVEPVPFPFRFGITNNRYGGFFFDFDAAGKHLLVASSNGMLHAVRTDGSRFEVLRRAMIDLDGKKVLTQLRQVKGVAGGFVVVGTAGDKLVAAHYDFAQRSCKAYCLGAGNWVNEGVYYYSDLQSVVAFEYYYGVATPCAIDLGTGQIERRYGTGRPYSVQTTDVKIPPASPSNDDLNSPTRAWQACVRAMHRDLPTLEVGHKPRAHMVNECHMALSPMTGILAIRPKLCRTQSCPLVDGQPLLKGQKIVQALYANNTLLISTVSEKLQVNDGNLRTTPCNLAIMLGPEWRLAAHFPAGKTMTDVALSADGQFFARQIGNTEVEVRSVADPSRVCAVTPRGLCHNNIQVTFGDRWLCLRLPTVAHLFAWGSADGLEYKQGAIPINKGEPPLRIFETAAQTRYQLGFGRPSCLSYDPSRFRRYGGNTLIAACDEFGQVALLERRGELVCMFFAYRKEWAAWMPDGTRAGSARLGGPPTPGAEKKIGQALLEACRRGEEAMR
jgi:hypothetical protein